ncbi:MAG TPA: D-alanine--D-alanine ligase [Mesotoga infera]|uniref:D-alanine--D-alanine ligase n=1 Tax=Mesotoga infera TaxID=1236046 RepID=A0A7C1H2H2_9BACT|nr:D-alanine--D-alanine ligase [Mesotoga infera]
MTRKVAVVYGGFSNERDVSIKSGMNIAKSLERLEIEVLPFDLKRDTIADLLKLKTDLFFLALHGKFGEDGTIQGMLELADLPYTGSDSRTSAICFDKEITYRLVDGTAELPVWKRVESVRDVEGWEIFPCVIKPVREGSSIGVYICDDHSILENRIEELLVTYDSLLLEEYISGREVTVSVIDSIDGPVVLPILEIRPKKRFYDYEAKYTEGFTDFVVPAPLEESVQKAIIDKSVAIYKLLGCRDLSRIDGILREDTFYFLEVNTMPGMTDLSDLPMSARAMGMTFEDVVGGVVEVAERRNRR